MRDLKWDQSIEYYGKVLTGSEIAQCSEKCIFGSPLFHLTVIKRNSIL